MPDVPDDDQLITLLDDPLPDQTDGDRRWKVAIIDDDIAVHDGTRFALSDFRLNGMGLEFVSAASAAEGRVLLRRHPDVAVILLDVVMESDEAGLELVDYVRRELGNETARIILRTGQPGHAPERRVVVDYDINDYKAKTELTAEKLFTAMTAALRSFEQLRHLTRMRQGLEVIADAASALHQARAAGELAEAALGQLGRLVEGGELSSLMLAEIEATGDLSILGRTGRYRLFDSVGALEAAYPQLTGMIDEILIGRSIRFAPGVCVASVPAGNHRAVIVFDIQREPSPADRALFSVFVARLAAAFENVALYEALEEANAALEEKVLERSAQLCAANQRLEAQADELRRVNALKNELLGIVAHDLKNPIGVILGRAEILGEHLDKAPPDISAAQTQLDAIRDSARRLTGIIDARIAEARRDAPEMTLHRRRFDLAELVRRVVDANGAHAVRKNQTLDLSLDGPLEIDGDEDRIADAIDNLVSNALKYSPVGGFVRVVAAREDGEAVVRVADSGPGIAATDGGRLFGQFQRLSAVPTGGEGSTGLGLYSAKRIVDLHMGRIGLERGDEPEPSGSVFYLALPLGGGR